MKITEKINFKNKNVCLNSKHNWSKLTKNNHSRVSSSVSDIVFNPILDSKFAAKNNNNNFNINKYCLNSQNLNKNKNLNTVNNKICSSLLEERSNTTASNNINLFKISNKNFYNNNNNLLNLTSKLSTYNNSSNIMFKSICSSNYLSKDTRNLKDSCINIYNKDFNFGNNKQSSLNKNIEVINNYKNVLYNSITNKGLYNKPINLNKNVFGYKLLQQSNNISNDVQDKIIKFNKKLDKISNNSLNYTNSLDEIRNYRLNTFDNLNNNKNSIENNNKESSNLDNISNIIYNKSFINKLLERIKNKKYNTKENRQLDIISKDKFYNSIKKYKKSKKNASYLNNIHNTNFKINDFQHQFNTDYNVNEDLLLIKNCNLKISYKKSFNESLIRFNSRKATALVFSTYKNNKNNQLHNNSIINTNKILKKHSLPNNLKYYNYHNYKTSTNIINENKENLNEFKNKNKNNNLKNNIYTKFNNLTFKNLSSDKILLEKKDASNSKLNNSNKFNIKNKGNYSINKIKNIKHYNLITKMNIINSHSNISKNTNFKNSKNYLLKYNVNKDTLVFYILSNYEKKLQKSLNKKYNKETFNKYKYFFVVLNNTIVVSPDNINGKLIKVKLTLTSDKFLNTFINLVCLEFKLNNSNIKNIFDIYGNNVNNLINYQSCIVIVSTTVLYTGLILQLVPNKVKKLIKNEILENIIEESNKIDNILNNKNKLNINNEKLLNKSKSNISYVIKKSNSCELKKKNLLKRIFKKKKLIIINYNKLFKKTTKIIQTISSENTLDNKIQLFILNNLKNSRFVNTSILNNYNVYTPLDVRKSLINDLNKNYNKLSIISKKSFYTRNSISLLSCNNNSINSYKYKLFINNIGIYFKNKAYILNKCISNNNNNKEKNLINNNRNNSSLIKTSNKNIDSKKRLCCYSDFDVDNLECDSNDQLINNLNEYCYYSDYDNELKLKQNFNSLKTILQKKEINNKNQNISLKNIFNKFKYSFKIDNSKNKLLKYLSIIDFYYNNKINKLKKSKLSKLNYKKNANKELSNNNTNLKNNINNNSDNNIKEYSNNFDLKNDKKIINSCINTDYSNISNKNNLKRYNSTLHIKSNNNNLLYNTDLFKDSNEISDRSRKIKDYPHKRNSNFVNSLEILHNKRKMSSLINDSPNNILIFSKSKSSQLKSETNKALRTSIKNNKVVKNKNLDSLIKSIDKYNLSKKKLKNILYKKSYFKSYYKQSDIDFNIDKHLPENNQNKILKSNVPNILTGTMNNWIKKVELNYKCNNIDIDEDALGKNKKKDFVKNNIKKVSNIRFVADKMVEEAVPNLIDLNIPKISKLYPHLDIKSLYEIYSKFKTLLKLSIILNDNSQQIKKGIDFKVFKNGISQMNKESDSLAKQIFSCLNLNKSGCLNYEEFMQGLIIINSQYIEDKVNLFFKIIDSDGNGLLSYNEVKDLCIQSLKRSIGEPTNNKKHNLKENRISNNNLANNFDFNNALSSLAEYFSDMIFKMINISKDEEIPLEKIRDVRLI